MFYNRAARFTSSGIIYLHACLHDNAHSDMYNAIHMVYSFHIISSFPPSLSMSDLLHMLQRTRRKRGWGKEGRGSIEGRRGGGKRREGRKRGKEGKCVGEGGLVLTSLG